jgi:putative transposase
VRFAFIAEEAKAGKPVRPLCRALEVTPQGYYRFLQEPSGQRAKERVKLDKLVVGLFKIHAGRYGAPRLRKALAADHGVAVSKTQVERSMTRQSLRARPKRRFVITTKADESAKHSTNILNRDFTATRPHEKWVTDITYLWTYEGWLYLAGTLDLFSRKVVGWAIGTSLETTLPLDALSMGLCNRRGFEDQPLLHHSDRGCQYTSKEYGDALADAGITVSMSRKGDCWDNAVAESFFATLKKELFFRRSWKTKAELELAVFEYIEAYYNRRRLHSSLGYRTPESVEADFISNQPAA